MSLGHKLYRAWMLPAWDLLRRTHISGALRDLERTQWLSPGELRAIQERRLQRIISHAYAQVPYYRKTFDKLGLSPESIKTVEDLGRLPIVTKATIQENRDELVARNAEEHGRRPHSTGGSTGEPLQYFHSRESRSFHYAALLRAWSFAGYRYGDRMATLAGLSLLPHGAGLVKRWLNTAVFGRNLPLPASNLTHELMSEYVALLRRFRPRFLRGYPSAVYVLADYAQHAGIRDLQFEAVMVTAETCLPHYREKIEEQFRCRVFDQYGAMDGGGSASECDRHQGYHIDVDVCVLEFVTDTGPAQPGELGKIISTDLFNYAMPFLRYETGDLGVLSERPCSCGRGLPLMTRVEGRLTEIIVTPDRRQLSGPGLTLAFRDLPLKQWQIVQRKPDEVIIRIVKAPEFRESHAKTIEERFRTIMGPQMHILLEPVSAIPTTRGGKRLVVLSELASPRAGER